MDVVNKFYCGAVSAFVKKYKDSGADVEKVNEISNAIAI